MMAILFGFVVIGRASSSTCNQCMCGKVYANRNNNASNDNNNNKKDNNENMNNFSSSNTVVTYFDSNKLDSLQTGESSLPQLMKSVSNPILIDPIPLKNDESIIYSTTSITDTSETRTTSKLCNSGILTLDNFDSVSPYAAVNIDDIRSPNFDKILSNIIIEDVNEDSPGVENNVDEAAGTINFINSKQEEAKSGSNLSVSQKESFSDKNTLPSSEFDANFMKNLSCNAFSSTNTIANMTTTCNSNSTFYSLRVDKPVKPNIKMNSYRIQQEFGKTTR